MSNLTKGQQRFLDKQKAKRKAKKDPGTILIAPDGTETVLTIKDIQAYVETKQIEKDNIDRRRKMYFERLVQRAESVKKIALTIGYHILERYDLLIRIRSIPPECYGYMQHIITVKENYLKVFDSDGDYMFSMSLDAPRNAFDFWTLDHITDPKMLAIISSFEPEWLEKYSLNSFFHDRIHSQPGEQFKAAKKEIDGDTE